jgi:N-acetylglucosamine malate deacetylase 1
VVEFFGRQEMKNVQSAKRVAVVVAHADDEVLGCGGTLKRHTLSGDEVWTIILADGESSRLDGDAAAKRTVGHLIEKRKQATVNASSVLGIQHIETHDFPDNQMDTCPLLDIVKAIEGHFSSIAPHIVYTHHFGDVNVDHRIVHEAVITACRPMPSCAVEQLLFFETPSSTEWQAPHSGKAFLPNWFVDISETLPDKLAALKCYKDEMRAWPHARSYKAVEHLARWRGATVGCEAAEAFTLGRAIRVVGGARKL